MRCFCLLVVGMALATSPWSHRAAEAQPRVSETGQHATDVRTTWTMGRAGYTRELWVGLESATASAEQLRVALSTACSDQTSIATISVAAKQGTEAPSADEQATLNAVGARDALWTLLSKVGFVDSGNVRTSAGKSARIVLVGVNESCVTTLRLATGANAADGLLLVDPPVFDLPLIEDAAKPLGVDVLLHPRSDAEFAREETEVRKRLGPWGKSARVMRGPVPFADLNQRLAWAWHELRGYWLDSPSREGETPVEAWLRARKDRNVIHVGELHGNPGAHRLQLEVLREMIKQGGPLALSTEQFERDVQPVLDRYLKGEITEEAFLKDARPWPNYADYRPLIELCKANKIPVIAGNIPRRLASRVHKEGPGVVDQFTDEEKGWAARKLVAEKGAYRDKFMKLMGGAGDHNEKLETMFAAQCIKDDTMAESIADWLKANAKGRVLHINGAFHSEGGLGVPEKLAAINPGLKQAMLTCIERDNEIPKPAADETYATVPASRPAR